MSEEKLFVEKYRPKTIDDCILTDDLHYTFKNMVKTEEIPNMILEGVSGVGKTTISKALCEELGVDYIFINGSEYGNIDTLRTTIRDFASTVSFAGEGKPKVVILDEADNLNKNSFQPALRGFIEEFSETTQFILTCNYKQKIMKELHSRCSCISFKIPKEERKNIAIKIQKRIISILDKEGIEYEKNAINQIITRFFPDIRRMLVEIQRYSGGGSNKIDSGIFEIIDNKELDSLIGDIRAAKFKNVVQWVNDYASDYEQQELIYLIQNKLLETAKNEQKPPIILLTQQYCRDSADVTIPEVNISAYLIEIMETLNN